MITRTTMRIAALGEARFDAGKGHKDFLCITYCTGVGGAVIIEEKIYSGRKIFARLEEKQVREIVDRWIDEIVHGLVTVIHIFNPSCVVLGGGVMEQPYILEQADKKTKERIMDSFRNVELKRAALGNRAGLMGASWLAGQLMMTD